MVRAAFAIFLFAVLLGAPSAVCAEDKILDETAFVATNPPKPLPPFLFEDEKGRTLDMKEFKGRMVLLNLWATYCRPCVAEMSKLDELKGKLDKEKWAIITLDEDVDGDSLTRPFYKNHNIRNLDVYHDGTGRAPFVLQTNGLPTTLLINSKGEEIARLEGPADWDKDSMVAYLKALAMK